MATSRKKKSRSPSLRLEGEMTIYRAAEWKASVLAALAEAGPALELDLSGVTELDTAGVQVLMLAKREAHARACPLRLTNHSAAVLDVFELLNLAAYFGDPLVMASPARA